MQLCLHRANDYHAWFMSSPIQVKKYHNELQSSLDTLEVLKENGKLSKYEVKFYNFDTYSHFGIFDDNIMFGDLLPKYSEKKTVQIGRIQTLNNIGCNKSFFENKITFFDECFSQSIYDSGLKRLKKDCSFCDTTKLILNPHHRKGSAIKFGKCDISLLENIDSIEDFIIEPDIHPISELHVLFICKFHILNFYDYLCHKDAVNNMNRIFNIIRNVIYKKTGREILIFEHGSVSENSDVSASSVDHLHIHIIFKPEKLDYISIIEEENIIQKENSVDSDSKQNYELYYSSLEDFANETLLKNRDYIMILSPGENIKDNKISVWIPQRKESQFLRKIFFQCLSDEEKKRLYRTNINKIFDDEYNWKKHEFQYCDEHLNFLKEIGNLIQEEIIKWRQLNN